mgnify:CR=1 FL=1
MNAFEISSLSDYIEEENPEHWNIQYFYQNERPVDFVKIPKTPEVEIHWSMERYISDIRSHDLKPFYVAKANGLRLAIFNNVGSAALMASDNRIFKDVSTSYMDEFKDMDFPEPQRVESKSVLLSVDAGSNYFHWMCHVLPKIHLLNESKIDWNEINKIILPQNGGSFVKETLDILDIPQDKILETQKGNHYVFDSLVVPCKPNRHIHMSRWSFDFLRDSFLKGGPPPSVKLFVSRRDSSGRGISNKDEVKAVLDPLGFQEVFLEDYSVAEQARLFNGATEIISPHGASLTNLAFCEPSTKVIELFSPNYVHPLYWNFCNILDLDYYYLIGEGKRPERGVDPHLKNEKISVNIDELKKIIT